MNLFSNDVVDARVKEFLRGDRFSSDLRVKFNKHESITTRQEQVLRILAGMRVIDFGFCDHVPLIDAKRKDGVWMHDKIKAVADKVVGVDINRAAIEHLQAAGYDGHVHDVFSDEPLPETVTNEKFDFLFMGDVLEHVDNPVSFLQHVRATFGNCKKILITVPNGMSIRNIVAAISAQEPVNTDHRYWFSPFTLAKVAEASGIDVLELGLTNTELRASAFFKRILLNVFPMLRNNIYLIGDL